jgi:hypothetical protein
MKAIKELRGQDSELKTESSEMATSTNTGTDTGMSPRWNASYFSGTSVMYAAKGDQLVWRECDYDVGTWALSRPKEVRAYRQNLERRGAKKPRLRKSQLHDELVVILGPEMSPKQAVETLRSLARRIEEMGGLLTGRDCSGQHVAESFSGRWISLP